jgi:hypothetical protein
MMGVSRDTYIQGGRALGGREVWDKNSEAGNGEELQRKKLQETGFSVGGVLSPNQSMPGGLGCIWCSRLSLSSDILHSSPGDSGGGGEVPLTIAMILSLRSRST